MDADDVPGVLAHQIAARYPHRQAEALAFGGSVFYRDLNTPDVAARVIDAQRVQRGCR